MALANSFQYHQAEAKEKRIQGMSNIEFRKILCEGLLGRVVTTEYQERQYWTSSDQSICTSIRPHDTCFGHETKRKSSGGFDKVRKMCKMCYKESKRVTRVSTGCLSCKVPLCINCMYKWHYPDM